MAFQRALCPRFHKAVELIGARWTGAIIQLLLPGQARFAELRAAIPDISDRMLSERLRELEAEAIIARSVIPEVPVRVEYALTKKGRALEDAMGAIVQWAEEWVPDPSAKPPERRKTRSDDRTEAPARRTPRRKAPHTRQVHEH